MSDILEDGYEPTPQQLRALGAAGGSPVAELVLTARGSVDAAALEVAVDRVLARHDALHTAVEVPGAGRAVTGKVVTRQTLSELPDGGWRVTLTGSAWAFDAWSAGRLCAEIAESYVRPGADAEVVSYSAAAAWQHEIARAPDAAAGHAYWRNTCAAGPSDVVPVTRVHDAARRGGRARVPVELSPAIRQQVEEAGAAARGLVLACWSAVLTRAAGAPVVVGMACDGRGYPELAAAVGPYARYLPVRLECLHTASLRDLAEQADAALAAGELWQEYASWPSGDGASVALAMDFVDNAATHTAGGVRFAVEDWDTVIDHCELRLLVHRTAAGLRLWLVHDTARYDDADVRCLAEQLAAALGAPPGTHPAALPAVARQTALALSGATPRLPGPPCLHRLVDQAACADPGRVAVRGTTLVLTYSELEALTNVLADRLRLTGVRRGDVVGALLDDGAEFVVAALAAAKSGASVMALDPALSPSDLGRLVRGRDRRVVITSTAHAEVLAGVVELVCLDDPGDLPADGTRETGAGAQDLVHVSETAGATALPRAVAHEHRGAVAAALGLARAARFDRHTRLLLTAAPGGHGMLVDAIAVLSAGGEVVAPSFSGRDPRTTSDLLVDHQVTAWSTTPSLLAAVLDADPGSAPWPVRTLVLDGEPIPEPLLGRVTERAPRAVVVGLYGTAEAGTRAIVTSDSASGGVAGRPLPGGRAYVVDERFELCPAGVPGEIVLGGTGVGVGYVDRPGATAERFVPDPFSETPGARLVRTGDAGVLRPDGTLGVLGRIGDRAGRRGAWRPPGVVTAALYAQPGVRMAAVVTRADLPGVPLVAHVVGGRAERITAALAGRLPAHLVPSEVVAVRALAFTATGRVDWSADVRRDSGAPDHMPPSNAVEQDLAEVCAELLRIDRVGMADNIFHLGGTSLLMARLSGRITALHGVEIPLRRLFTAKTVREIANMIINAQLADVDEAEYAALVSDLDSGKDSL